MKEQKWIIAIVVALVAMGGIFLSLSKKAEPTIKNEEVNFTDFGQYLKDQGVVLYGASTCPHCQNQKKTLGDGTWQAVYTECIVPGKRQLAKACEDAKIEAFPTWAFKDGSTKVGEISVDELMKITGYDIASTGTNPIKEVQPEMPNQPEIIVQPEIPSQPEVIVQPEMPEQQQ